MCGVLEVGDAKDWYSHFKNGSFHEVLAKYFSHIIKAQYFGLGFWPLASNWRSNHDVIGLAPTIVDEIDLEDPIILPYCKPKNMQFMLKIVAYTP